MVTLVVFERIFLFEVQQIVKHITHQYSFYSAFYSNSSKNQAKTSISVSSCIDRRLFQVTTTMPTVLLYQREPLYSNK